MRALLMNEYKRMELADMPLPAIGDGDVLVRVKACGICGSDVHGFAGATGRRLPPIVMGHEASGIIAGVGKNVKHLQEGDRVTFDSTVYCGRCFFCRRGEINLCDNREVLGVSTPEFRRHGAFAEYVSVPAHIIYKLPDSFPFEHAAMIEAVSIGVHAVNITPVTLGDTGLVVGTGMIGLLTIQALKLAGASRIIAVDLDDAQLEMARKLGAEVTVTPKRQDVAEVVKGLTDGRGADVALEAVGATAPIQTALAALKKGGALTLVGNVSPKIELPLQVVVSRQIRLMGSCASCGEFPQCIDLMARGAIQVADLISARAPLEDGPQWFEKLYGHAEGVMKVVLEP